MIFLPANTTSLIIAELDDIQDQSEGSAVAKKISLFDALHLVAMLWKGVSQKTIENCFRKGGFSKTNAETPASEESDLTSENFRSSPRRNEKRRI